MINIFAGYPDKMEAFLNKNPGLRSRIAFHVHNADELCRISEMIAKQKGLTVSESALEKMRGIYERISKEPDFGNGRAARNVVEAAKMALASRLLQGDISKLTDRDISTILPEDISEPILTSKATTRRVIGF